MLDTHLIGIAWEQIVIPHLSELDRLTIRITLRVWDEWLSVKISELGNARELLADFADRRKSAGNVLHVTIADEVPVTVHVAVLVSEVRCLVRGRGRLILKGGRIQYARVSR